MEQKIPTAMARNARYRGQRESEKYLQDKIEQEYDIRTNWKDLDAVTKLQQESTSAWINGDKSGIIMLTQEKTFRIDPYNGTYLLMDKVHERHFQDIVIELESNTFATSDYYSVQSGYLLLNYPAIYSATGLNPGTIHNKLMTVSYKVSMIGLFELSARLHEIDERIKENERRYSMYEVSYK
jgi:hypothetical protein